MRPGPGPGPDVRQTADRWIRWVAPLVGLALLAGLLLSEQPAVFAQEGGPAATVVAPGPYGSFGDHQGPLQSDPWSWTFPYAGGHLTLHLYQAPAPSWTTDPSATSGTPQEQGQEQEQEQEDGE